MKHKVKIGIIGGSGLDNADILSDRKETHVQTHFGNPSDVIIEGNIQGVPCALLARHARDHSIMPTDVNYRANIMALKSVGCTHLVVSTACGSLKEEINPGDIVILDSFIDRTTKRQCTFYDRTSPSFPGVCHLPMEPAFCNRTRQIIMQCAEKLHFKYHETGTCITIEGPRFSSRAESKLFKSWGGDVINMTTVPEVVLAKEAGLCYAAIALVTDYDSWRDVGSFVSVSDVLESFRKNVKKVTELIISSVIEIGNLDWDETIDSLQVGFRICNCTEAMRIVSWSTTLSAIYTVF
ncbi:UNVERIFIED_CONTAM: hypothetical protein PYX00_000947 [Menopon gallinae]|uniref:S-methyl-5'-thioadenosine phosphorylase n=1 Tax=Menopon gallinae TaxID=328185 RepID=A0AAW2ID20_9NEOP